MSLLSRTCVLSHSNTFHTGISAPFGIEIFTMLVAQIILIAKIVFGKKVDFWNIVGLQNNSSLQINDTERVCPEARKRINDFCRIRVGAWRENNLSFTKLAFVVAVTFTRKIRITVRVDTNSIQ